MMTSYRIVRRPSYVYPTQAIYEVQRRVLWWWEKTGTGFLGLEAAKKQILELQAAEANPIKRKIVYQEP